MKLQNLSVIFVIIVLPLILLLSYYISLQIDTINLQTAYDSKLLDSTKEAIDAFEINTVEWNPNYSEVADSKRRDVMASINTFITSFSNNIGIGGTSRENILSYMPSIVYTLYDGYYIYSAADVKPTIVNDNGVAITIDEDLCKKNEITGYIYNKSDNGKLLYQPAGGDIDGYYRGQAFTLDSDKAVEPEYKHILKPFSPYSEKIEGTNLVINYTLDNYITIYGEVENEAGNKEYVSKSGYLTKPDKIGGITHNSVTGIEFNEKTIEPEILEEQIAYKDDLGNMQVDSFIYVYEKGNTKVYYDNTGTTDSIGNRFYFFRLDTDNKRIWVNEASNLYKKCTVPRYNSGEWTYLELYQDLGNGNWYTTNDGKNYEIKYNVGDSLPSGMSYDLRYDYSAINYCTESWLFTNWYNQIVKEAIGTTDNQYYIKSTNDPEVESSAFCLNKGEVIKQVVNSDLQQSISSYSRNTPNEYRIPELTEEDWNQILRNASIITFIQNIPIGMKYYNNYAIATSTVNKEYVDPNEIYLNTTGDTYYHMPYCSSLTENNLIGYRRIDYIQKSYNIVNTPTPIKKYYYRHSDNKNTNKDVEEACYNCLIQKSEYEEDKTDLKEKAYYTALVRERYIARMTKLPPEIEPGYSLHVEMVNSEAASQKLYAGESSYRIDGDLYNFETFIKIKKDFIFPKTYNIEAVNEGETGGGTAPTPTTDTGDLNSPKNTINTELTKTPTYVSDSKIKVTINNYDTTGIQITYSDCQNVEWGSGETSATYDNITPNSISSDVGTGYVNVKLKYKPNYSVNETTKKVKAWANINDYNNLTIVTETTGITGKVRLAFVNNGVVYYYSEDTFDISEGAKIYCKIPGDGLEGDTRWYSHDWEVRVITTNNDLIASGTVEYYTIKDSPGLKGFADAVNGTQGPITGAKTSGRTFKLFNDIKDVGTMAPIAGKSEKWFDGTFEGQNYTITGVTIDTDTSKYNAFGLFGWVGKPAKIENLTIDNIEVNYIGTNNDIKVGGLAGFADEGESISNVIVKNSTITGGNYTGGLVGQSKKTIACSGASDTNSIDAVSNTTIRGDGYTGGIAGQVFSAILGMDVNKVTITGKSYVGGIVGYAKASITNSNVKTNSSIQSIGNTTKKSDNYIYIGGIAAYTEKEIVGCNVNGTIKYSGTSVNDWKISDPGSNTYVMRMYVGGIAGRAKSTIKNCHVQGAIGSRDVKFSTGNVISSNDDVKYYVGGYIGYLEGNIIFENQKTLENLSVTGGLVYKNDANKCYKSYTGGLVGYNNQSEIKNITNKIAVTSSGYNTGGIAGYNNGKNIHHCINTATISGLGNVGGIVGWTNGGYIYQCGNTGTINGNSNINNPINEKFFGVNFGEWWFSTEGSHCTGTGGISGKTDYATIAESYNHGAINCNYNGGGISGIDLNSVFKYCYNRNSVTASERGRVGGICGASVGVQIYSSYNTGNIKAKNGTSVVTVELIEGFDLEGISYGVGGLVGVGFCNDFRYGTEYKKIDLGLFSINLPYIEHKANQIIIMSSYSSGKIERRNRQLVW